MIFARGRRTQAFMMLVVSELLQPFYVRFCKTTFGIPDVSTMSMLDDLWEAICNGSKMDNSKALIEEYFEKAPDTEDHDLIFTSRAMDFCNSIGILLQFLDAPDDGKLLDVLGYLSEMGGEVDLMIDSPDNPQSDLYSEIFQAVAVILGSIKIDESSKSGRATKMLRKIFRSKGWQQRALLVSA